MKNLIIIALPLILAFSAILVISSTNMHVFAQQENQTATPTNQTATPTNQTATPTNQTATPTNQTATPTNQTATPTNQTATPTNQTATPTNQTSVSDLKNKMNEKLLNFTNQVIIALKDKNKSGEEDALKTMQKMLINASGKQLVVIPSDALIKSKSK